MEEDGCVVTIPTYSTKHDEGAKDGYTAYHIVIKWKSNEWRTYVRYSTFRQLHDAVKRRFPSIRLPKLPPKKLMGNASEEFLEKRRVELETYLRELLSVPIIRASEEVSRTLELSSVIELASPSESTTIGGFNATAASATTTTAAAPSPDSGGSSTSAPPSSEHSSAHSSSYDTSFTKAVALYDFEGDAAQNQMSFTINEVIYVMNQDDPEQTGWWWGEKEDGTQGYLPCDFIRLEDKSHDSPIHSAITSPPVVEPTPPSPPEEPPQSPVVPSLALNLSSGGLSDSGRNHRVATPPVQSSPQERNPPTPPSPHAKPLSGSTSTAPAVSGSPAAQLPPVRPRIEVVNKKPPPPVPVRGQSLPTLSAGTSVGMQTTTPIPSGSPAATNKFSYGVGGSSVGLQINLSQNSLQSGQASGGGAAKSGDPAHPDASRPVSPRAPVGGARPYQPGLSPARPAIPQRPRGEASAVTPIGRSLDNSGELTMSSDGHRPPPGTHAIMSPAPQPTAADKSNRRTMIATEILTTERTYVEGLTWLIDDYKATMLKLCAEPHTGVTDAVIKKVFSNLEIIKKLNEMFLKDLEKRMEAWDTNKTLVADLFKGLAPYLKMYKDYSNNFETATETCQQLRENSAVTAALDTVKPRCQNLTIEALLITPIQRLPRYNLLIQDLLRNTPETHPDHNNLADALKSTKEIADYINESIRQAEQSAKFRNLATQGEQFRRLLEAHRTLVTEGKVTLAERKTKSQWMLCLFNDIIVPAKLQRGEIMPQLTVPLTLTWLHAEVQGVKEPAFAIITPERAFVFVVATAQERQHWLKAVSDGILSNIHSKPDMDNIRRYGTYAYSTGGEFTGHWQVGKRHGAGRLEYFNGNIYEGQWHEDMRHGQGTLTYATGEVYEGEWVNDRKEGQGTMKHTNGTVYVGQWKDGLRSGHGTITFANGDVFEGKFIGDKAHGKGKLRYSNGNTFEGFFEDDRKHGLGSFKSADGARSYQGNWVNGRKEGTGMMTYGDGSMYQGSWHDDKRQGHGKLIEKDGSEYVGDWVKDMRDGKGTYATSYGHTYDGQWREDKRNGHGTLATREGDRYEGEWSNDRRQGKGIMTFGSGDRYEGAWHQDRPHGNGLWTSADGSKFEGKWTNGARDGKCSLEAAFVGVCKENAVIGQGDKVYELASSLPDLNML